MTTTSKTSDQSIHLWLKNSLGRKDQTAFMFKKKGQWIKKNYFEYLQLVTHMQSVINEQHVPKGGKVAIMSATRWEWACTDIATLAMGSILVPIYPNLTDDDVVYILDHCEADLLIVDNKKTHAQFERAKARIQKPIKCLVFDELDMDAGYVAESSIQLMIERAAPIKFEDPATIIYTSGTTGKPKGVLLQHQALISEVYEAFSLFQLGPDDLSLAFLPYAHVMGRIEHWGVLFRGCQVAYAESIELLKRNLGEVKPTFLVAVPRIFEKIYSGIATLVATNPIKKTLFNQTLSLAKKIAYYRDTNQAAPITHALAYEGLSKIVLGPIRQAFGGRLRFAISGGAPLSPELGQFFSYLGIRIFEGYGLTETFAAITVNTESHWELGTVGRPIGDVEIKFAADGEILVRSKKILKEYFKNPEATAEAINAEGFFATGDIGELTPGGFLKITDRKKDLIKTAGGKYVAPQKLEGLLKEEPVISQVFICGDQKKYISALITVESLPVDATAEAKSAVLQAIKIQVQKVNSQLASYESIKKFEVLFEVWSVENGCLTPSMKVKRKFIENRYAHIIDDMYGGGSAE
ncbi:long-chain fatty acid--CoA ligase [Bdellovibrio sp. qaytius]|nr:long-chain fatty acid--CoA ligase [Bdellovibrio sp. qaytius]